MDLRKTILTLLAVALFATPLIGRTEEQHSIMTALSNTTLSGYVDTSTSWWVGTQTIPNDYAAGAVTVETNSVAVPANLTSATLEQGEPAATNQTGSVWYKWTTAQTGLARISVVPISPMAGPAATSTTPALSDESIFYPWGGIGYGGDGSVTTVIITDGSGGFFPPSYIGYRKWSIHLAVYRVAEITDTRVSLDFIKRSESVDYVEFDAHAGDTFFVAIEVYQNSPSYEGQEEIPYTPPPFLFFDLTPAPANDSFASSFNISDSANADLTGHTIAVTREPGEPDLGGEFSGGSVWFHYKAATYGMLSFLSNGPFAVFSGDAVSNLKLLGKKGNEPLKIFGEEGKVYHIAIYAEPQNRNYYLEVSGPRYRRYETVVADLFPGGITPHFYGVRGTTMLIYAKAATGWDLTVIEPIVNQSADLLIQPSTALDGQLRVITIDETLPSPHIVLRHARGLLVADLSGIPGQTCAVSYSSDLVNWSEPEVFTLTSSIWAWRAFDSTHPNYFFRVTQSLPQPTGPQTSIGVRTQTPG